MIFQIFKNKYLDLESNFNKQHLLFSDAIILSKNIHLDSNSRYISHANNLHNLLSNNYDSSLSKFFEDFFNYESDRPVVIYSDLKDFKYIITSFFKSIYHHYTKDKIYKLCDLTLDKIFFTENIDLEFELEEFNILYQIASSDLVTDKMAQFLPFEIRYGDYKSKNKSSIVFESLVSDIEKMALREMREMIREIKNFFILQPNKFFFQDKISLRKNFKSTHYFIFDPLVVNYEKDNDIYKIIDKYGIDLICEMYVKTFEAEVKYSLKGDVILAIPVSGNLPSYSVEFVNLDDKTLSDSIKNIVINKQIKPKLNIINSKNFSTLLEDKDWFFNIMQMSSYRKRINFYMLNYFYENPMSLYF